jgi:hypothetical protein
MRAAKLQLVHSSTKGAIVTPAKRDATNDRQAVMTVNPGVIASDVLSVTLAENRSLREALAKIYGEAMMSTEPPASTWYRITEIVELALAREWRAARS